MSTQHIVSVSGGKDSTAVYLMALERGVDFRAVFADTGNEHEWTYEFIRRLHERTGGPKVEWVTADFSERLAKRPERIREKWTKDGLPPERIEAAAENTYSRGNPFLDLSLLKARFPSSRARFCTEELKVLPIHKQVIFPALRQGRVLQWLGIRKDESRARAKMPRYNRDDTGAYLWRPIFNWTVDDVFAFHKRHGLEPNPLYAHGMNRVGCMPCVMCSKGELAEIANRFPEQIDRIAEWEKIVSESSRRESATFFVAPEMGVRGNDSEVLELANVRKRVRWAKTSHGGKQFDIWKSACPSDLGVCE